MEIVIKIPDEDYEYLKTHNKHGLYSSILNGTPLPKGHGRLMILLEDAVKREQHVVSFSRQKWISEVGLSNATVAIIEADKESEDKE